MKILLIGNEIQAREKITCYSDMQSYYLSRALQRMNIGVTYHSGSISSPDTYTESLLDTTASSNVDHIIALGVRFFQRNSHIIGSTLQTHFGGLVCQIHDGSMLDDFPADLNFCVKDDEYRYHGNENNRLTRHRSANHFIGWAADASMFYPEQEDDETLRVFVDHSTFTENSADYSLNVLMSLKRLRDDIRAKKAGKYTALQVKTLSNQGICDVNLDHICIEPYNRFSVSAEQFSSELRKSHVFMVTHTESVGLCVLEAAMSGCAVYIPKGTIAPDLMDCVRCTEFINSVDWRDLQAKVTPELNSLFVQKYSWDAVAQNIVRGLVSFRKRTLLPKYQALLKT